MISSLKRLAGICLNLMGSKLYMIVVLYKGYGGIAYQCPWPTSQGHRSAFLKFAFCLTTQAVFKLGLPNCIRLKYSTRDRTGKHIGDLDLVSKITGQH